MQTTVRAQPDSLDRLEIEITIRMRVGDARKAAEQITAWAQTQEKGWVPWPASSLVSGVIVAVENVRKAFAATIDGLEKPDE